MEFAAERLYKVPQITTRSLHIPKSVNFTCPCAFSITLSNLRSLEVLVSRTNCFPVHEPVNYFIRVKIDQSQGDFRRVKTRLRFLKEHNYMIFDELDLEFMLVLNMIHQISAGHVFHHEEKPLRSLKGRMHSRQKRWLKSEKTV